MITPQPPGLPSQYGLLWPGRFLPSIFRGKSISDWSSIREAGDVSIFPLSSRIEGVAEVVQPSCVKVWCVFMSTFCRFSFVGCSLAEHVLPVSAFAPATLPFHLAMPLRRLASVLICGLPDRQRLLCRCQRDIGDIEGVRPRNRETSAVMSIQVCNREKTC